MAFRGQQLGRAAANVGRPGWSTFPTSSAFPLGRRRGRCRAKGDCANHAQKCCGPAVWASSTESCLELTNPADLAHPFRRVHCSSRHSHPSASIPVASSRQVRDGSRPPGRGVVALSCLLRHGRMAPSVDTPAVRPSAGEKVSGASTTIMSGNVSLHDDACAVRGGDLGSISLASFRPTLGWKLMRRPSSP